MSGKRKLRRLVVMRPTECEAARYACDYVAEFSDMDGDLTKADGERSAEASEALGRADSRCIDLDVRAIEAGIDAIVNHCSCMRPRARNGWKHQDGCHVQLHERDLDRLVSLLAFLRSAP